MKVLAGTVRWRVALWSSLWITLIYSLFAGCVFLAFRYGCVAQSRTRLNNVLTLVEHEVSKAPDRLASIEKALPECSFYVLGEGRPQAAHSGLRHVVPAPLGAGRASQRSAMGRW